MAGYPNLRFTANCLTGTVNATSGTIKALLVGSTYDLVNGRKAHQFRSSVTGEITGTNYTAGGIALPSAGTVSISETSNLVTLSFPSFTFVNVTVLNVYAALLYKSTGSSSTDPLIGQIVFAGPESRTAQDLVILASTIKYQHS